MTSDEKRVSKTDPQKPAGFAVRNSLLTTPNSAVVLAIEFSSSVSGMGIEAFDISLVRVGIIPTLSGTGRHYNLTISVVDPIHPCPIGFSSSTEYCARVVEASTHSDAVAACLPYTLASITSSSRMTFLRGLTSAPLVWYGAMPLTFACIVTNVVQQGWSKALR